MGAIWDDLKGTAIIGYPWHYRRPIIAGPCIHGILWKGFSLSPWVSLAIAGVLAILIEAFCRRLLRNGWRWPYGRWLLGAYFAITGAFLGLFVSIPFTIILPGYLVPGVFSKTSTAENVIGTCILALGAVAWPTFQLLRLRPSKGRGKAWGWSHGTARWAGLEDLEKAELLKNTGVILGRFNHPAGSKLVSWDQPGHLLTVAPTRSGKGIGAIIPNLLVWPGSVIVTDPKGENFAVTQRIRRSMGQRVFNLDPFEVCGPTSRFNPLDAMDPASIDVADDARVLADALLVSSGDPRAAFWEDNARSILQALILYTLSEAPRDKRHLPNVRHLLMCGPEEWEQVIGRMRESTAAHGLLSRLGNSIAQMSEKTLQDVLSTAKASTDFLDSPRLEKALSSSDFDLADLKAGDLSVYLILPPDKIQAYSRFLRLVIGAALQACTRAKSLSPYPALFLLDEFAQLGHLEKVKQAYTLLGGYGVKIWAFLQDLAQLEHSYKEGAQTFLANASVKQFFGVSDTKTSEEVSKMLGEQTITVDSYGSNQGRSAAGSSSGTSDNLSQTGRSLLKPDEVRRLSKTHQIIIVQGENPIFGEKITYYKDDFFKGRYDRNPMHQTTASEPEPFRVGQTPCPYCGRLNLIGRPTCEGCGGALLAPVES